MNAILCDRCGAIVVTGTASYFVMRVSARGNRASQYTKIEEGHHDLCLPCRGSLIKWMAKKGVEGED